MLPFTLVPSLRNTVTLLPVPILLTCSLARRSPVTAWDWPRINCVFANKKITARNNIDVLLIIFSPELSRIYPTALVLLPIDAQIVLAYRFSRAVVGASLQNHNVIFTRQ